MVGTGSSAAASARRLDPFCTRHGGAPRPRVRARFGGSALDRALGASAWRARLFRHVGVRPSRRAPARVEARPLGQLHSYGLSSVARAVARRVRRRQPGAEPRQRLHGRPYLRADRARRPACDSERALGGGLGRLRGRALAVAPLRRFPAVRDLVHLSLHAGGVASPARAVARRDASLGSRRPRAGRRRQRSGERGDGLSCRIDPALLGTLA